MQYYCLDITWKAAAVVGGISFLDTSASILTWWGAAGHVRGLTVLASILLWAAAVVRANLIYTNATI